MWESSKVGTHRDLSFDLLNQCPHKMSIVWLVEYPFECRDAASQIKRRVHSHRLYY